MKQYEIWWAAFPSPTGPRPVLLLSRDAAFRFLKRVLVVEIWTNIRDIPQELTLGRREGLPRDSAASFDNIRRVPKSFLEHRLGQLPSWRVDEVKRALGHTVGWTELTNL